MSAQLLPFVRPRRELAILAKATAFPPEAQEDADAALICNLVLQLEQGCGGSIAPVAASGLTGAVAMVVVRIGGIAHGLEPGAARIAARMLEDEQARDDAPTVAFHLNRAADVAEGLANQARNAKAQGIEWNGTVQDVAFFEFAPALKARA